MVKKPTLILLLMLFSALSFAQITGLNPVCEGVNTNYTVPSIPGAVYSWTVTGGNPVTASNTNTFGVSWGLPGTGTLLCTITQGTSNTFYTLNVTINPKPNPVITPTPYASCPRDTGRHTSPAGQGEGDPCYRVCKNATLTYSTPLNAGSTYSWVATGASLILGATTNNVTVTWDNTPTGSLTVYETNIYGCIDSATICIKKEDLPVAGFTHPTSVCKNTLVNFTNTSSGGTSYFWTFGDGGTSTLQHPTHTYTSGGTFTVTLLVTNDCFCTATFSSAINVSSLPGPEIACPSTVCAGDTATYSTGASGCTYLWTATGGTILGSSTGQSVTVIWGPGQMGQICSQVSGCGGLCTAPTCINIPITPVNGIISGPAKVCPGDCAVYSLPYFSGATFNWTFTGHCGQIKDSTNCNDIEICFNNFPANCNDTLCVTYYDSLLQCGGSACFVIRERPVLSIFGQDLVCANSSSNYSAAWGTSCNWSISPAGPTLSPANPTSFVTVNWNGFVGNFIITAIPNNPNSVCNNAAYFSVKSVLPPARPVITGNNLICPNSTESYCATGNGTINWVITGGTPSTSIGPCVTVSWANTGPYLVQAYVTGTTKPYCQSSRDTMTITPYGILPAPTTNGPAALCANATTTFASPTIYPPGAIFQWNVLPTNAGSIISGQGTSSANIEWGNNAPQAVTITLAVTACGQTVSSSSVMTLNPAPVVSVNQVGTLCAGGSVSLVASGASTYVWSNTSVGNTITVTTPGLYLVTGTNANGCTDIASHTVQVTSGPTAMISSPNNLAFCIGSSISANLCALTNPNYSYQWSSGQVTPCITASSVGTYWVTVTDASNGCVSVSNTLAVTQVTCTGGGTGTCQPNGVIRFTRTGCNPISFTNTSISGSNYSWDFGDGFTSGLTSPTHFYNQAGFYLVTLTGNVPGMVVGTTCTMSFQLSVTVPLAPKFDVAVGCGNAPVCFTNRSTNTVNSPVTSYLWSFGDASTSTLQNPCHTYTSPGVYVVTLTIGNGTCTSSTSQTITVPNLPVANFTSSNPNCVNSNVAFSNTSIGSINQWSWTFGDGGTSLNQNPNHSYSTAGIKNVNLTVTDITGCTATVLKTVTVTAPLALGQITASDTMVCAGTPVSLTAPFCASCTYSWSTGATTQTIVIGTTGIYVVNITDPNGCKYSRYIRIIVNNPPPAIITNSGSDDLCVGDFTSLSVPYFPTWSYLWSNGSTNNSIFFSAVTPGNFPFTVIVTDLLTGCLDTSLVYWLYVHPNPVPPTITAFGPAIACQGDTIRLIVTHVDPLVTFEWSNGAVNDTIYITKDECIQVAAINQWGCRNTATYCPNIYPMPDLCCFYEGCLDTCAPFLIYGPCTGNTYQWLFNGVPIAGPSGTMQNYLATLSGNYSCIATTPNGCIDTTGLLQLSLRNCDSLCGDLEMDSIICKGDHYEVHYNITNNSPHVINQVNFQVLAPHHWLPTAPSMVMTSIPSGGNSGPLVAFIYSATPGDTICFRVHLAAFASDGTMLLCCPSDTICVELPPCDPDTTCCPFNYLGQRVNCTPNPVSYTFEVYIQSCGDVVIQSPNSGTLNVPGTVTLGPGTTTISGTYIPSSSTDTLLCLTYIQYVGGVICKDTTICFRLRCPQNPVENCNLHFPASACVGQQAYFQYMGSPIPAGINWSFLGGSPATATGPGVHYVTYSAPGVYQFSMSYTNSNGVMVQCRDSIVIHPTPVGTISQNGNALFAFPSGNTYQWYSNNTPIPGATNQFYTSSTNGTYCVVVTNPQGCASTPTCYNFVMVGAEEAMLSQWSLYPNPNAGNFIFDINSPNSEDLEISMVNQLGSVVKTMRVNKPSGSLKLDIDCTELSAGLYYFRMKNSEGISVRKVIIGK